MHRDCPCRLLLQPEGPAEAEDHLRVREVGAVEAQPEQQSWPLQIHEKLELAAAAAEEEQGEEEQRRCFPAQAWRTWTSLCHP